MSKSTHDKQCSLGCDHCWEDCLCGCEECQNIDAFGTIYGQELDDLENDEIDHTEEGFMNGPAVGTRK